jgi:hypothetical protein
VTDVDEVARALKLVGLAHLVDPMDKVASWDQILSGSESRGWRSRGFFSIGPTLSRPGRSLQAPRQTGPDTFIIDRHENLEGVVVVFSARFQATISPLTAEHLAGLDRCTSNERGAGTPKGSERNVRNRT